MYDRSRRAGKNRLGRAAIGSATAAALLLLARPLWANNYTWIAPDGGDWTNPSNWTPFGTPSTTSDAALINFDGMANPAVTLDASQEVFSLEIGNVGGGTNTLSQTSGANLTIAGSESVGSRFGARGVHSQSAGTNRFFTWGSFLTVGGGGSFAVPGSVGTYNLSGTGSIVLGGFSGFLGIGSGAGAIGTFNQGSGSPTVAIGDPTVAGNSVGLSLGGVDGGVGFYNLGAGSLSVIGDERIGDGDGSGSGISSGTFAQTGGAHLVGSADNTRNVYIGYASNSKGSYSLSDGATYSVRGSEFVGYAGAGSFVQNGGTHVVSQSLTLANSFGVAGSYSLAGNGTLRTQNTTIGSYGSANFTQTGGTHVISADLQIGQFPGSSGTYRISGGSATAASASVGGGFGGPCGSGSLVVSGTGNLQITNLLQVGSSGLVAIDGATLAVNGIIYNDGEIQLVSPTSQLFGGTLVNNRLVDGMGRVTADLVNNSTGEFRASGAQRLTFAGSANNNYGKINLVNGGTIEFTGALSNFAGGVIAGRGALFSGGLSNSGQLQLSGGFSDIYGAVSNTNGSKITVSGGSTTTFYNAVSMNAGSECHVSAGSTAVFFGAVTGAGAFTGSGTKLFEGGQSSLAALASGVGDTVIENSASVATARLAEDSVTLNGGRLNLTPGGATASVVNNLTTAAGGQLDLTNNSMVIRGMTPPQVQALVQGSFNAGHWNGNGGLNSSTAAGSSTTAIGFASNSILSKSSFKGVTGLTAGDVLVKYTYYGDADLSGATTLDDFTLFLYGYQNGGSTWVFGDFDYSGQTTLDDFTLFLAGYRQQGAPLGQIESLIASAPLSPADRSAMLAAVQAVPEPAALGAIGLLGLGLSRRRRR